MCGIVAAVSKQGGISGEAICRATRRLIHRGPDAQRVWVDEDGRVALGHARLSIIDLDDRRSADRERRRPPADSSSTASSMTSSGFAASSSAKATSSARARTARSRCTCTRIAAPRALHSLRGEFAFAIWDARDGQLFAARDRFGIKPLYYAVHDGTFYLASEVKALAALGVPLRWDRDSAVRRPLRRRTLPIARSSRASISCRPRATC